MNITTLTVNARPAQILLADAESASRAFLADNLTADGASVRSTATREGAINELIHGQDGVDLIVADVNGHTLELVDTIRNLDELTSAGDADVPIVILSRYTEELHRVRLLEHGADDVIAKPYSYPEVRARAAAILRRSDTRPQTIRHAGPIHLDTHTRQVTVAGQDVALTNLEYRLLDMLSADPTRVWTREELLTRIWPGLPSRARAVDVHLSRLRIKLTAAGASAVMITFRGVGVQLLSPHES